MAQTELINQWSQLTKNTFDSLRELGEINVKFAERLSRQQLDWLTASAEIAAQGAQLVTRSGGYAELLDKHTTFATDYNRKFLDIVRQTSDILSETRDEISAWVERGVQTAERSVEVAGRTVERSVQWGVERAEDGVTRAARATESAGRRAGKTVNGAARSASK